MTDEPRSGMPGTGGSDAPVITESYDDWHANIALHGEFDLSNADELRAELGRHIDAGRRVIRADASAVTFVDSTALGALLEASARCRSAQGVLILTNVPARLHRLIKVTGLEQTLLVDAVTPNGADDAGEPADR